MAPGSQQHLFDSETAELYLNAANRGNTAAQSNLGSMFERGNAIPQNTLMYYHGKGVPQDNADALEWVSKAVNQGHADAKTILDASYQDGEGALQNNAKVIELFNDWHVDPEYAPGRRLTATVPCAAYPDSPAVANHSSSSWSDYNCDSFVKLGDLDHPDELAAACGIMANASSTIYPTVGNHEAGPANQFPTTASGESLSWLYNDLASDWSRWLLARVTNFVKSYSVYTVSPQPGFRIISLYTNVCYIVNYYLYANNGDYDSNGQINWLITHLQASDFRT
ncbi:hypothetical protein BGZ83_011489 [Gryganskiella cystojenkinii]|nr:hypothetical protein BGZ83_011489 [Gryganskiella cystojenkinii]